MWIDVYSDLVSKCIDEKHGRIDGNKRYAVVCQVVFVWKKECSVVVFIMFLPKTRNNWLTGRVLNTLHSRIVCAQIRAKEWYVYVFMYVYAYIVETGLAARAWRHIVASYIQNHSRTDYTRSIYIYIYIYVNRHACTGCSRPIDRAR